MRLLLVAAAILALAACSSSSPRASSATPTTVAAAAPSASTTTSTTTSTGPTTTGAPLAAGTFGVKPVVTSPGGTPPTALQVTDLIAGTGPAVTTGESVTVQYVGVSWTYGKQFDASWDRNQPFTFTLGAGQVIPGWDQGIPGMHVDGRRELIIPPNLAYGANAPTPAIAPNDTLIFVVDMISASPAGSSPTTG